MSEGDGERGCERAFRLQVERQNERHDGGALGDVQKKDRNPRPQPCGFEGIHGAHVPAARGADVHAAPVAGDEVRGRYGASKVGGRCEQGGVEHRL